MKRKYYYRYIDPINQKEFIIAPSENKLKKYDVYHNNKKISSFGAIKSDGTPYDQYFDKIGYYKDYNHYDNERKKRYYKRHGKKAKKYSAKYWSHIFLW